MNVFVLCTGRCGSTSFFQACRHMTNYTTSHEDKRGVIGRDRFSYPENHVAVDYRLAWMLGRLDTVYGKDAFYVHLTRDPLATAKSFARMAQIERSSSHIVDIFNLPRWMNTMGAPVFAHQHVHALKMLPLEVVAEDMVKSINCDIWMFLKDKNWLPVRLEHVDEDFPKVWERIGAEGDLQAALSEWRERHNDIETVERKANAVTVAAMAEAQSGDMPSFSAVEDLMVDLNA